MDRKTEEKTSRHTWIGDEEEVKAVSGPGADNKRAAYADPANVSGESIETRATRLVEKQKKPYSGFITDEELKAGSDIIRIDDRKTRVISKSDIPRRLSDDPGKAGMSTPDGLADGKKDPAKEKKRRTRTIKIADPKKFRRLIALLAVFAVLVLFEISYFAMRAASAALPGKTQKAIAQTETIEAENRELREESASYGDYEDVKELKESWERLRDKLAE